MDTSCAPFRGCFPLPCPCSTRSWSELSFESSPDTCRSVCLASWKCVFVCARERKMRGKWRPGGHQGLKGKLYNRRGLAHSFLHPVVSTSFSNTTISPFELVSLVKVPFLGALVVVQDSSQYDFYIVLYTVKKTVCFLSITTDCRAMVTQSPVITQIVFYYRLF